MPTVTCVALAGALLLVAAAGAKLVRPQPLVAAMRSAGLPASDVATRVLAAVEGLVGAAAVVTGWTVAWAAVAASYGALTAFVLRVRRRSGSIASCGCFGAADAPAGAGHVAVTAGYGIVAAVAAAGPAPGIAVVGAAATTVSVALVAVAVAFATHAVLTAMPHAGALASTGR